MAAAVLPQSWAETLLYPAGAYAWSGTQTKVAPSANSQAYGMTPQNPTGAQEFNYVLNKTVHLAGNALVAPAMNFVVAVTVAGGVSPTYVKWDPYNRTWNGASQGLNDIFIRSYGSGGFGFDAWESTTELGAVNNLVPVWDFSTKANGDMYLMSSNTAKYWYWTRATSTWSHGTDAGLTIASSPCVEFEPVSGNFLGFNTNGTSLFQAFWSLGGPPSSTAATAPTGFVMSAGGGFQVGVDGLGGAVAVNFDYAGSTVKFSKSVDGGKNWTASTSFALGFQPIIANVNARFCKPVWNGSYWMVVVSNNTTQVSKVFTSSDGVNWTNVSSQSLGNTLSFLANIGDLWLSWAQASTTATGVFGPRFSVDAGATWHATDQAIAQNPFWVVSNGQRFHAIGGVTCWMSLAMGLGFS